VQKLEVSNWLSEGDRFATYVKIGWAHIFIVYYLLTAECLHHQEVCAGILGLFILALMVRKLLLVD
jgi:hypothetical protein